MPLGYRRLPVPNRHLAHALALLLALLVVVAELLAGAPLAPNGLCRK